jgi:hypothetical protein
MVNFTPARLFVFALLAVGFQTAAAGPTPVARSVEARDVVTNAERMRRGLPLLKPRNLSGTLAARAPAPSGSSGKSCIKVKKNHGGGFKDVGYISDTLNAHGLFPIQPHMDKCLEIVTPTHGGPCNIPFANPGSTKKYLGLAGEHRYTAAYLVKSNQTPANSGPANVGNSATQLSLSETSIWTYDLSTTRLTARWQDENNQVISPVRTFIQGTSLDTLYFAHRYTDFTNANNDEVEVWLDLVSA